MCYVDEGGDVATRRAELRDYGFECACERCVREAPGLGQARRGGKTKSMQRRFDSAAERTCSVNS